MTALTSFLTDKLNKVRPSGHGFILAACPVHKNGQERNPSFSVNTRTGTYKCFSCGIHGSFEDLKILLNDPLLTLDSSTTHPEVEYHDTVNEVVLALFRRCPVSLIEAGFTEETLLEHEIGYDTVYNRITFPIRNTAGKLVAISGRAADGIEPRYKVYTQKMLRGGADLFDEPHKVYKPRNKDWLWMAHKLPKDPSTVFITEGFKACMWMRQCGVSNTIATMGTMVTKHQLSELQRICSRAIIVFDMDHSGKEASKKLQQLLLKRGVPTSILTYPKTQPDELTEAEIQQLTTHYLR